eukprot:1161544-Pelagomonas_calceolata.AAC.6
MCMRAGRQSWCRGPCPDRGHHCLHCHHARDMQLWQAHECACAQGGKAGAVDHALTEETIASTAAMPAPAVLFKRCRQISTVMLKLLRKGRNLKEDLFWNLIFTWHHHAQAAERGAQPSKASRQFLGALTFLHTMLRADVQQGRNLRMQMWVSERIVDGWVGSQTFLSPGCKSLEYKLGCGLGASISLCLERWFGKFVAEPVCLKGRGHEWSIACMEHEGKAQLPSLLTKGGRCAERAVVRQGPAAVITDERRALCKKSSCAARPSCRHH